MLTRVARGSTGGSCSRLAAGWQTRDAEARAGEPICRGARELDSSVLATHPSIFDETADLGTPPPRGPLAVADSRACDEVGTGNGPAH